MHSAPHAAPKEPASGQSDSVNGEARGVKRKWGGPSAAVSPSVDASGTLSLERMRLLSKLTQRRRAVDNVKTVWGDVLEVFKDARPRDISFVLLYSVHDKESVASEPETSLDDQTSITPEQLILEGLVGLDDESQEKLHLLCQILPIEICKKKQQFAEPSLLRQEQNSALLKIMALVNLHRDVIADAVVLCPIVACDTDITAFIILGVRLHQYDDDFAMFAHILSDNLGNSVTSLILRKKLKDVAMASETLLQRAEEAERSNFMFRHMAESATVGCAIFDPSGRPNWLNEAYVNLTGVSREDFRPGIWQKAIVPEDLAAVEGRWNKLASGEPIIPFTFRVKRHRDPTAKPGSCESLDYRWLLSNAYVDFNEDGSCRRVMGWLTDISAQKWIEHLQAQRLADALETKRQTEKFIDMVSHEIRNPLSAIIQTADGVLTSMDDRKKDSIPSDIRDNIVDAGKTIVLCAHHQKRIVDDILTLSKLDSNLLVISPNQVRPHDLVQNAMKMFEAELSSSQIEASITVDESYRTLSIETVLLDESRVLQILLNLITNAIKFTRNQEERYVRIRLAASQSRPSIESSDISYIAPRVSQQTNQDPPESGTGKNIYLVFAVEDTGPGLGKDDMKSLFQRFSQASPKTYRGYGGFGLGLFICRELAELQGGQIGLSSALGQGTTFTFYVQAQRCKSDAPEPQATLTVETLDVVEQARIHTLTKAPRTSHPSPRPQPSAPPLPVIEAQTLHVLVVEDNKINQTVLVRQLRLLGCTVYTADHGLEALELLSRSNFQVAPNRDNGVLTPPIRLSVILMDIEMPVMDGLTCVRRIREMEREGTVTRVPVIAVTANARSDQISRAMEAGMDSVVTKPFRIPELIPKIASVVLGQVTRM